MRDPDFGTDESCGDDLTPEGFEVSGYTLLAQDLVWRLQTPRGSMPDDPNYGIDARDDVSRSMTPNEALSLPNRYAAELEEDDRVLRVEPITSSKVPELIQTRFQVFTTQGPFKFTASIDKARVLVSEVDPA